MTSFSIKDLSDFSGIKPHTIRIWEQRFTFLKPQRNNSLRRLYSPGELNVLLDVSLLNQSGYKVSRIAKMTNEEKAALVLKLDLFQQQQRHIHDLIISMAEMDTDRFEAILDNCILYYGIHTTILKVIMPFCTRIGLLEKLDSKNYIENILLIKELVKSKLHFGIERAFSSKKDERTVLLFLPIGEHQELLLLYLHYMLKMEGLKIVYLGKHVSMDNLEKICQLKKPDFILTQLLEKYIRNDLSSFGKRVPEILPNTKLITIGNPLTIVQSHHYTRVTSADVALFEIQQNEPKKYQEAYVS